MNSSYVRCLGIVFPLLSITAQAQGLQPWQKPWSSVKADSARKCAEIFDQFQLQAVCMENEKTGYEKMQRHFGMPPDLAIRAKEKCTRVFDQFQLQAVCMENEKTGYEKMKKYR